MHNSMYKLNREEKEIFSKRFYMKLKKIAAAPKTVVERPDVSIPFD